jgi:hypothetical protein
MNCFYVLCFMTCILLYFYVQLLSQQVERLNSHSQPQHVTLFFLNIMLCWLIAIFICIQHSNWDVSCYSLLPIFASMSKQHASWLYRPNLFAFNVLKLVTHLESHYDIVLYVTLWIWFEVLALCPWHRIELG